MTSLDFRSAEPGDAERCHAIDVASYEGDEAATVARITTRITDYPQEILILEVDGELAGHDPAAPHVVILSVVVDPQHQDRGYARQLMQEFSTRMRRLHKQTTRLMCRDQHLKRPDPVTAALVDTKCPPGFEAPPLDRMDGSAPPSRDDLAADAMK